MYEFSILDINPLSDIWFANIFSHLLGCLFILLAVSLLYRNFLIWYSLTCLFLLLMSNPKHHHQNRCHEAYSLGFLLEVLWFQVLTFKSLIHFQLFFVNRGPVSFFACGCTVSLTWFIEETVLSPVYSIGPFVLN